jgi:glutathione S-transferase
MPTLYGADGSPFVRKARVFLAEKGISYDHEPVIPFNVSDEYRKISPLGKIPAFRDDNVTLADSSVICSYLERIHPEPALYPKDPVDYARALWFEEYGDGGLLPVVGKIFFPKIIAPIFFNQQPDEAAIAKVVEEELPRFFDYLEGQIGGKDFLVGNRFTIGDIGVATGFVNLRHCGVGVDAKRWPNLARYVAAIHARASFKTLIEEETRSFGLAS